MINDVSEIQSNTQSIDESIEEKLKNMLPGLITKIKTELQDEIMSQSKASEKPESTFDEKRPKVTHQYINCDECEKKNITGIRYKCAICNDFDLCEQCEATSEHAHPFLKIKDPKQKPLKIIYIMEDIEDSLEVNGQRHQMNGLSNLIEQGINFAQNFAQGFNVPQPQTCEKKVEKKEEKVEEKKETVEPKVEPKVEKKVEPTIEKKEKPQTETKPEQKKEEKNSQREQNLIENANYLADLMNLNFTRAYKFSQKYPGLSKEEVLNLYLSHQR